jgi:hypothetical protein
MAETLIGVKEGHDSVEDLRPIALLPESLILKSRTPLGDAAFFFQLKPQWPRNSCRPQ